MTTSPTHWNAIVLRGLALAALCIVLGSINGVLALFGGIVGDWLAPSGTRSPRQPVVVVAIALPVIFWLWVCIPIALQVIKLVRPQSPTNYTLTAFWISALCAGFLLSIVLGLGTVFLPNIYGVIAGLACWPFLMVLMRKPIGWSVICLVLGGIFGYLLWAEIIQVDALLPQFLLNSAGLYLAIAIPAFVVLIPIPFIFFLAPNFPLSDHHTNAHLCPACSYDLRGLSDTTVQCPECGTVILRA